MRLLARLLLSVWLLISLNFFLLRALPGSPLENDEVLNPLVRQHLARQFHLDESLWSQYFYYLTGVVTGDLGPSTSYAGSSAAQVIGHHLSVSLILNVLALALVAVMSFLWIFGLQMDHHGRIARVFYFFSLVFVSAPTVLLAPLLILIVSVYWGLLPAAFLSSGWHYLLPAFILALRPSVHLTRTWSTLIQEEWSNDYVRTARAKGISNFKILYSHVLKNSLVPLLSLLPPLTVGLLSGSAFVEILFAIPGVGLLFVDSLRERDYFLASALVLTFGALMISLSLGCEAWARKVDPRLAERI